MLEFLYTGSIRDLHASPGAALDVLSIANYTGLEGLKSLCEAALMHATGTCEKCLHCNCILYWGARACSQHFRKLDILNACEDCRPGERVFDSNSLGTRV